MTIVYDSQLSTDEAVRVLKAKLKSVGIHFMEGHIEVSVDGGEWKWYIHPKEEARRARSHHNP
jgi:hypothetical protein